MQNSTNNILNAKCANAKHTKYIKHANTTLIIYLKYTKIKSILSLPPHLKTSIVLNVNKIM